MTSGLFYVSILVTDIHWHYCLVRAKAILICHCFKPPFQGFKTKPSKLGKGLHEPSAMDYMKTQDKY